VAGITEDQRNVGTAADSGAGATLALVTANPVAAGATVFISAGANATVVASVSSIGGVTWVVDTTSATGNSFASQIRGYCPTGLPAGTTINITYAAGDTGKQAVASSLLGVDPTSPLVSVGAGTSSASAQDWASTSMTPPANGVTIAATSYFSSGGTTDGGTNAPASGTTELNNARNSGTDDEVVLSYRTTAGTLGGHFTTAASAWNCAVATYKAAPDASTSNPRAPRAFQEENDPRAFQPQGFQRSDPANAFEEPNGTLGYGFGFQPAAFQRPDPTGAFEDAAFQRSAFQDDFQAFEELAYQGDAFQEGTRPPSTVGGLVVSGVGAIASLEAFGATKVVRILAPVALASAEAFGTTRALRVIGPSGIVGAEAFGAPRALRILAPVGIVSASAFGTSKLVRLLAPVGLASAEAFGTTRLLRILGPAGIASGQAFGQPVLLRVMAPVGVASAAAFGTTKVIRILGVVGVASGEAWGKPTEVGGIYSSAIVISGVGAIASLEAFGVVKALRILAPVAMISATAFGTAKSIRILGPAGVASGQAFGTTSAQRLLRISAGIASAEAFGQAGRLTRILGPGAANLGEVFGTPKTLRIVRAVNISTGEAFGTASLVDPRLITASAAGSVALADGTGATVVVSDGEAALMATVFGFGVFGEGPFGGDSVAPLTLMVGDSLAHRVVVADGETWVVTVTDAAVFDVSFSDRPGG
jgi:hypothetical protein